MLRVSNPCSQLVQTDTFNGRFPGKHKLVGHKLIL